MWDGHDKVASAIGCTVNTIELIDYMKISKLRQALTICQYSYLFMVMSEKPYLSHGVIPIGE